MEDKMTGQVTDSPEPTIGQIRADRWVLIMLGAVVGAIVAGLQDWGLRAVFLALAVLIHAEARSIRQSLWPESYHATRKAIDDVEELSR
jgi:hydroxyethylthiazole kinase-like sugar kinase family protein